MDKRKLFNFPMPEARVRTEAILPSIVSAVQVLFERP
jgi:hypothetical protein